METVEKISKLNEFKALLLEWRNATSSSPSEESVRTSINYNMKWVEKEVSDAKCLRMLSITHNSGACSVTKSVNPFSDFFDIADNEVIMSMIDMIERTIGVLNS
jgi:hypothetical protein